LSDTTLKDLIERERPLTRRDRRLRVIALLAPFVVTVLILGATWIFAGFGMVRDIAANAVLSFFALGKFLVVKGISPRGFTPWELALIVFYLDLAVAFLLTFNLYLAYRIPLFGRRLEVLQSYGEEVLAERPWLRKLTNLGVALFVMFPLTGTGAIGGSLFGRLLGLSRIRTFVGIALGSAIGCFGMAALADIMATLIPEDVRASLWFELTGVGLIILLVLFLLHRSRKIEGGKSRQAMSQRESPE
jgi:uncharacterized membrane protein